MASSAIDLDPTSSDDDAAPAPAPARVLTQEEKRLQEKREKRERQQAEVVTLSSDENEPTFKHARTIQAQAQASDAGASRRDEAVASRAAEDKAAVASRAELKLKLEAEQAEAEENVKRLKEVSAQAAKQEAASVKAATEAEEEREQEASAEAGARANAQGAKAEADEREARVDGARSKFEAARAELEAAQGQFAEARGWQSALERAAAGARTSLSQAESTSREAKEAAERCGAEAKAAEAAEASAVAAAAEAVLRTDAASSPAWFSMVTVFTHEDLLELILHHGGLEFLLVVASVCRSFRDATASASLWRSLGPPGSTGAPHVAGGGAAGGNPVGRQQGVISSDWSSRELYRGLWLSERWASGKVTPAASVVRLCAARPAGDVRKLQVKINSAACSSQYVCLGGADASIQCFNLEGQHTHDLAGHNKAVRVLEACERGGETWLASAAGEDSVRLWRLHALGASAGGAFAYGRLNFMFSLAQAGGNTHPAALQFFKAAAQPVPPVILTDGNGYASLVQWRPDGDPVVTPCVDTDTDMTDTHAHAHSCSCACPGASVLYVYEYVPGGLRVHRLLPPACRSTLAVPQ